MRSAYLDYAMSVIVGRALPDVRDGLKPVHRRVLFAMNEAGPAAQPAVREVRAHRRRRDGQLPPARRLGDLRHARAHGAGLLDALPARRRPGQLRLGRRRPGRRHALHRGAPRAHRDARCCATSTRTPSTSGPTTTGSNQEPLVLPARFPNLLVNGVVRHRRRHGDEHPAAQPARDDRRATIAYIDDPDIDVDGLMQHIKGPDFPTGGVILGVSGIRDAYETGRGRVRVQAPRAHRAASAQGKEAIIVTELPYHGEEGRRRRPDPEDRRPRPRQEDPRDHRPARRVRPHAACGS